ncbi:DUF4282 domain-containing protein [Arsenophonus sp.]|uniref:DUF4282 domain-containing protein n=1 Tax=Arsenophonus sp. TaxID=1872640 RepID=UPI00285754ED|nr:DUF4282 domain-containing protein [Arsenophonus sp.]MDR5611149.1 DUF4282 domain-containing protein [Arsenophonus sp.]MDR5615130.1 DUF4282 domain-containing protein [Arsenophonus sp.]
MLKSLLRLDEMITPKIIIVFYWLGIIAVLFSGITAIIAGSYSEFFSSFIGGLAIIVIGIISVRVSCELIILLFNIYAKLKEITENTKIKP